MNPWPVIPDDVVAWFRSVFADANRGVCERLINLPNIRGMNAFIRRDGQQAAAALHRTFSFDETCIFAAIQAGHRQVGLINTLNRDFGKAVFYLLYAPPQLPYTVTYPLRQRIRIGDMRIGNRVVDADDVHGALAGLNDGQSPSFSLLHSACAGRDWSLETWAADLLLTCHVGQQFDDTNDDRVRYFLDRRSGPIGAALAASITLPDEA